MKISCQSCQAKYTIADEKVVGKIVKIRCKKCGATIVINGNDPESTTVSPTHAGDVMDFAAAQGSTDQWTVNVADGDQRTLTLSEIVTEYKSGVVTDDTFCWKDGMNDWLPLREIDQLYQACTMGPGALHAEGEASPASDTGGAALFASASHESNGNGAGALFGGGASTASSAAASAAARRTGGGRHGAGADLFGAVASAGGEDDVMTSALAGGAGAGGEVAGDQKLTGQRNENSVLFSLNALTSGGPEVAESKTTATGDGSGLIDIRALSANMGADTGPKKSNHVDDIMNLGGGGAFSAALAAPVLAPPSPDSSDPGAQGSQGGNKTLYMVLIGGFLFLGVAIIVGVMLFLKSNSTVSTDATKTSDTSSTATTASAAPTTAPAPTATDTSASAAATNTAKPIATGVSAGGGTGGGTKAASGGATHAAGGGGAVAAADPTPTPPPAPAQPKSLAEAMQGAAGGGTKPAAPAAEATGTAPFDRGAAAAALGGVNLASCKKPDGPTGSGHVRITFQPNGQVSTVEIDSGPFVGTPVGACIMGKFRSAHVPAFAGGPVPVGKSITLN